MYSSSSTGGRIVAIAFMIVWIATAIWMGFFFIDFAESWPDWGPGPSPSMFVWIPFAMAAVGVVALIVNIVGLIRGPDKPLFPRSLPIRRGGDDYISSSSSMTSGYGGQTDNYKIPKYCSNCGAKIDSELVEWVGPMELRCSSCGTTMRAEFG